MREIIVIAIIIFVLFLILNACTGKAISACPPIQIYTEEFNQNLAEAIEGLEESEGMYPIFRVLEDYIELRDQLKQCQ